MELSKHFSEIKDILEEMIASISYEEIEKIKQEYKEGTKDEHRRKM